MKKIIKFIKRLFKSYNKQEFSNLPLNPVSTKFGQDLGTPIDRFFIEKFIEENKNYIKGDVLEIAERKYTKLYGENVSKSLIMHVDKNYKADIYCNLETGEGVVEDIADCFIITQTLPFIFNIFNVAENCIKLLKKDGVLLLTVPGITQISNYDYERWGQYWSFTEQSIRKLFEKYVDPSKIKIKSYGNVKIATQFLYGIPLENVDKNDLLFNDNNYQLIITAVIKK